MLNFEKHSIKFGTGRAIETALRSRRNFLFGIIGGAAAAALAAGGFGKVAAQGSGGGGNGYCSQVPSPCKGISPSERFVSQTAGYEFFPDDQAKLSAAVTAILDAADRNPATMSCLSLIQNWLATPQQLGENPGRLCEFGLPAPMVGTFSLGALLTLRRWTPETVTSDYVAAQLNDVNWLIGQPLFTMNFLPQLTDQIRVEMADPSFEKRLDRALEMLRVASVETDNQSRLPRCIVNGNLVRGVSGQTLAAMLLTLFFH